VEVRALSHGDLQLMRDMLALFGEAFGDVDTYTARQPSDTYLDGLLASNLFIAIAALDGSTVIGGLAAYVLPKFEQARSEIYIYDLAVAESHRRRGVATAMIEHLKTMAAAHKAWVIYVHVFYSDAAATEIYTKLGVGEDVRHVDNDPSRALPGRRRGAERAPSDAQPGEIEHGEMILHAQHRCG
jgi:aminoglycoside 3-N-acetyltransferase I